MVDKMVKSFRSYLNEKQDAITHRSNLINKIKKSGVASGSMSDDDNTKKKYVDPLAAYHKAMKKHETTK